MRLEEWQKQRGKIRFLFSFVLAVLGVMLLLSAWHLSTADRSMEIYDLSKETTKLASTLFFDKLTAVAQVTIAIVGGVWALLMFGDRSQMVDAFRRRYFILANVAFGSSLLIYSLGYDFIVARLFHHGAFDVDSPFITAVRNWQLAFFIKGCVDLLGTAFSGSIRA